MNIERLQQLLEGYGADPARWPDEERLSAKQLLSTSEGATAMLEKARRLDEQLDAYVLDEDPARYQSLYDGIMIRTKRGIHWTERLIAWMFPARDSLNALWRPTLAAGMPLIAGILLGIAVPTGNNLSTDEELSLLGLSDANQLEWVNE